MGEDTVTIEEGNKLIMLFMGGIVSSSSIDANGIKTINSICYNDRFYRFFDMDAKYHSSWDWLMPVCKKINDLQPVDGKFKEMEEWWDLIDNSVTQNYDIKDVFPFVVEFIKWYNSFQK